MVLRFGSYVDIGSAISISRYRKLIAILTKYHIAIGASLYMHACAMKYPIIAIVFILNSMILSRNMHV